MTPSGEVIPSGALNTGLVTGPSAHIGGFSEYHIDLKLEDILPMQEKVNMFNQISRAYAEEGRQIEFLNPAVAGQRYELNASYEEKAVLLTRVAAAYSHSLHSGRSSYD